MSKQTIFESFPAFLAAFGSNFVDSFDFLADCLPLFMIFGSAFPFLAEVLDRVIFVTRRGFLQENGDNGDSAG